MQPDPYPRCPFCGTLDDWHKKHSDRMDCGGCDAIRLRPDASYPWQYVSPRTVRAARAAEASVRDVFEGDR